jgi:A/G-specific adenine glycosylase
VYARLTGDSTDIRAQEAKGKAGQFALLHMPHEKTKINAYTQALMELGALVCVPKNPRCGDCPLTADCEALQNQKQHLLPYKSKRSPHKNIDVTVLIIQNEAGGILMRRRKERLLHGLWVYYLIEEALSEPEIRHRVFSMGFGINSIEKMNRAKHIFTHLIWHMQCYRIKVSGGVDAPEDCVFISPEKFETIALPSALQYFTL